MQDEMIISLTVIPRQKFPDNFSPMLAHDVEVVSWKIKRDAFEG